MTNPEAQIASFFAKYEPPIAKLGRALRAKLRARLPGLSELVYVYENQGSLVISYSPTGNGIDAPCALAVYPDSVKLFFGKGAELSKADPNGLLQGRAGVRHVVMESAADLGRAEIEALIVAASNLARLRLDPGAKGPVIIKAEAQKKRAARKPAARSAHARGAARTRR